MEEKQFISIEEYCSYYSIETSFVRSLGENGLIELTQENETYILEYGQLARLEKFTHLHYELEVNLAGIEVISHLLEKINRLQAELLEKKQ